MIPVDKSNVRHIVIGLTTGERMMFNGYYIRERETENWHYYYNDDTNKIIHIRKEAMIYVKENLS